MKKITLIIALAITSVCARAQNFLGLYTFDSITTASGTTDPTPVPTSAGVIFGSFSSMGTPANPNASVRFDFTGWGLGSTGGTGDTLFSAMTGGVSTAEYYEVTVSPAAGHIINIDTIKFSFARSGTGVRCYAVRSSEDGYVSNLNAIYIAPNLIDTVEAGNIFFLRKDITTTQNKNEIILGGTSFSTLSSPTTFRFYAWNSEGNSGTFSIDNVKIIGSASLTVGIKEKTIDMISIYPNPTANGVFTFDKGNLNEKTIVSVYDLTGRIILSKEINSGNKQLIDLSNQANGSYFINIKSNSSTITRKITINR